MTTIIRPQTPYDTITTIITPERPETPYCNITDVTLQQNSSTEMSNENWARLMQRYRNNSVVDGNPVIERGRGN